MLVKKRIKSGVTSLNNRSVVSCSPSVSVYRIARDVTKGRRYGDQTVHCWSVKSGKRLDSWVRTFPLEPRKLHAVGFCV